MHQYLAHIEQLDDFGSILAFVRTIALEHGAVRQSYHFTPVFDGPTSADTIVYAEGFDQRWIALYDNEDFRAHDPIPARTMASGGMLTWSQAINLRPNDDDVIRYVEAMRAHGIEHGVGFALFGQRNRSAYASFGFDRPVSEIDDGKIALLRSLMQAAHNRICAIEASKEAEIKLSVRERDVLQWIGKGKSAGDIATIMGISAETVRTYIKRIYAKLDAGDRVGAIIKALKLGLIEV